MAWVAFVLGGLIAAYGTALSWAGWHLWQVGGSAFYVLAGLGTLLSGGLLATHRRVAMGVYGLVLAGTLAWAHAEVGFAAWLFLPRVAVPVLVGGLLCLPALIARRGWCARALGAVVAVLGLVGWVGSEQLLDAVPVAAVVPVSPANTAAWPGVPGAEQGWRHYGQGLDGRRYSQAAQITPANVATLERLWQYRTGEDPARAPDSRNLPAFEATPLQVGQRLYLCTPRNQVIALDARTGRELWRHDPQTRTVGNFYLVTCRGVAYFEVPAVAKVACPRRIIAATLDSRLFALDADTGQPCVGFGEHGVVSLRQHLGDIPPGFYGVTSAPTVARGLVIVGGLVLDNQSVDVPSGVVRAFDAITGQPRWAWDSGRPDSTALTVGEVYTRGSPNAWAPFSADEALGMVYLPTGNASPDYFGGLRSPEKERYASSVVALDLETGRPRWAFQIVHHDLWDYDVASQPVLVDLPDGQGGRVPALVQATKRGEIFLLDRRNGRPLHGVEERPAPTGAADGDHSAPTQPYATGLPSLAPPALTEKAMWGVTPLDQAWCRRAFVQARYAGHFTPPSLQGSVSYPNNMGASNWGGVSVDPANGWMVANTSYTASIVRLLPRVEADRRVAAGQRVYNPQAGTPYAVDALPFLSPLGLPCNQPPWGLLTAIDLVNRRVLWQRPFGTTAHRAPMGLALPMGLPSSGGSLLTASGLLVIGAADDGMLRIFETGTGHLLWQTRLPAAANATPMSYTLPDGRQVITVAAGGHTYLGSARGDYVVAYALPAPQMAVDATSHRP